LFRGHARLLDSHRGHDIGARAAARFLERRLGAPLVCGTVTRLLVDLNRSEGHRALLSELTRPLPEPARRELLACHYHPYRDLVASWIDAQLRRGARVLHVSVHSFTPVLDGRPRRADVGLLYDPARPAEKRVCRAWRAELALLEPGATTRLNYPYRGTSDGLVKSLRRRFPKGTYAGVELELNQARLRRTRGRAALLAGVAEALRVVANSGGR
jgi:predicted N-formylglutamate amidohydrolase